MIAYSYTGTLENYPVYGDIFLLFAHLSFYSPIEVVIWLEAEALEGGGNYGQPF